MIRVSIPTLRPCAGSTPRARATRNRSAWSTGCGHGSRPGADRLFVFQPPAAVLPEPLLGVLADPAFHDVGDDLHGARDVNFAVGIARRRDLVGELGAEAMAGQPDNMGSVNRAVEMEGKARQQWISPGAAAEEGHFDAAHVILIDQHADMGAAFQRLRDLYRRVEPGRDQFALSL